jgi:hypothetical protein
MRAHFWFGLADHDATATLPVERRELAASAGNRDRIVVGIASGIVAIVEFAAA